MNSRVHRWIRLLWRCMHITNCSWWNARPSVYRSCRRTSKQTKKRIFTCVFFLQLFHRYVYFTVMCILRLCVPYGTSSIICGVMNVISMRSRLNVLAVGGCTRIVRTKIKQNRTYVSPFVILDNYPDVFAVW